MFESWREVMGGILAHAGIKGFLGNLSELYEEADLEGAAYRAFVGEWWRERSDKEVGVKDLLDIALRTEPPLDLGDAGIRSQQSRLGKTTLMRMRNQVYDGLRVTNTGTYQGAQKWKLVKI